MAAKRIRLDLVTLKGESFSIPYADELAEFFFLSNSSSVGATSYDDWTLAAREPERITTGDIGSVNATMMARTSPKNWTQFTDTAKDQTQLTTIGRDWDLFEMPEKQWQANDVADHLGGLLKSVMGPYRGGAVTTKVLHIKRPRLIPVCDSLVANVMSTRIRDSNDWSRTLALIVHLRKQGRNNLEPLQGIQDQLLNLDPPMPRTLVRILDALLWMRGLGGGPYPVFAEWLEKAHG